MGAENNVWLLLSSVTFNERTTRSEGGEKPTVSQQDLMLAANVYFQGRHVDRTCHITIVSHDY